MFLKSAIRLPPFFHECNFEVLLFHIFCLSLVFAKVYNHNMNKWKNVTVILGLWVCAMWFIGCASKPVEEIANEDEYKREKAGERVALVMVDETVSGEDSAVEEVAELTETTDQTVTEEPIPEVFSNIINLAEITSRIVMIKNTSDNVDWNYQAIIPLS